LVCLAVFVDMMGFGIILPMLPFQAQRLGGSGVWVGLILTAYAAAQFVAAPVLGALSDSLGRRRILLLSLGGSAVSLAATGIASSLFTLLLARTVAGAFGGAIAVGQAYVVDLTSRRQRTRALGLVGASIGLGFVCGPAIGGLLAVAGVGFAGASFVAAGIAAVNLALGAALLPRTPNAEVVPAPTGTARHAAPTPDAGPVVAGAAARPNATEMVRLLPVRLASLRQAMQRPGLRPVVLAIFTSTLAFAGMETTFALLGQERFGLGPAGLGAIFAVIGVTMVIVQGGLVGRAADRYGDQAVAVAGAVLLAVGLVLVPFVPAWIAYPALVVLAVGQGLLSTTTASLVAQAGGRWVGGAFGISQSAASAARAAGPLAAGIAFDIGSPLPYVGGAILCAAAGVMLARLAPEPATVVS
jgi:DHA1 family tetracycline resistance protein-like MFS transporter